MPAVTREEFKDLVGNIGKGVNSETVFGETRMIDGRAVIPVAKVKYGGGGGFGSGPMHNGPEAESMTETEAEEGGGMGMGFSVKAQPIGFIEITEKEAVFRPLKHSAAKGFLLGVVLAAGATMGAVALMTVTAGVAYKAMGGSQGMMRRASMRRGELKGGAEAMSWMARRRAQMMGAHMQRSA